MIEFAFGSAISNLKALIFQEFLIRDTFRKRGLSQNSGDMQLKEKCASILNNCFLQES